MKRAVKRLLFFLFDCRISFLLFTFSANKPVDLLEKSCLRRLKRANKSSISGKFGLTLNFL
jgi:hypothetical protein